MKRRRFLKVALEVAPIAALIPVLPAIAESDDYTSDEIDALISAIKEEEVRQDAAIQAQREMIGDQIDNLHVQEERVHIDGAALGPELEKIFNQMLIEEVQKSAKFLIAS